jgi:hypothetical protein
METSITFIKENSIALVLGCMFFGLYLYYNSEGNQLCDCESTESYKPSNVRQGGINRFYHK